MASKQRNMVIDIMKGIGIILMMLCHLVYTDGLIRQFVYSFHMPLFFIVAGYLAKDIADWSQFVNYTNKNAKRLLLPYFFTMLIICTYGLIRAYFKNDISFILKPILSLLTASADGITTQWGLAYAGAMWFLIALFGVREIFGVLQLFLAKTRQKYRDAILLSICILISIVSVFIQSYIPSLPFCIMQSLTAIAFYAIGWYVYHHSMPWWVYGICVSVWPIAIVYGNIELESAYMACYPLSFIGACGGTYVVYILCKGIDKLHKFANGINITHCALLIHSPLAWCGMYSLPILCMHELEMNSDVYYSLMCRIPIVCERAWGGGNCNPLRVDNT